LNCVILAAGRNTRLDTGVPKSLISLGDETLLSRHIRVFKSLGINRFCIISGYRADCINETLEELIQRYEVEIEIYHNPHFDEENGLSVFTSKEWVEKHEISEFFLTMGDHIFEKAFLEKFIRESNNDAPLQLAVDKPGPQNAHIDIDDVTKVQVGTDHSIIKIGKSLTEYNYYDTGLFKMKFPVFDVFYQSFQDGKYQISDSVSELIKLRSALAVPVLGFAWNDVDNESDFKNTQSLFDEGRLDQS